MRWERLLFLHWRWSAPEIQLLLPRGLRVDTFADSAWLAIVPFFMRRVHPAGLFPLPGVSDFLELNVRTYVRDERGVPGVWFFSLACNQPLAVEVARRAFHLNYVHARMRASAGLRVVEYSSRRGTSPCADFRYGAAGDFREAAPGSLESFLVERYVLFSSGRRGRLYAGRVHHAPYRIAPADVSAWSFQPARDDGFPDPGCPPDHAVVAADVSVDAWPVVRTNSGV